MDMTQERIDEIRDNAVLIVVRVSSTSGKRQVTEEELGIKLPKGIVSRGAKCIYPPKKIRDLQRQRQRAESAVSARAVKLGPGVFVHSKDPDDLRSTLDEVAAIAAEHDRLLADMNANYETWRDEWLANEVDPEWREIIRKAGRTREEALGRCAFTYGVYEVAPVASAAEASGVQLIGLNGQLWKEIADVAGRTLKDSFDSDRDSVGQRALRPFRSIHDKLEALSFIDPDRVDTVTRYIGDLIASAPSSGELPPKLVTQLAGCLSNLADVDRGQAWIDTLAQLPQSMWATVKPDAAEQSAADDQTDAQDDQPDDAVTSDAPEREEEPVLDLF